MNSASPDEVSYGSNEMYWWKRSYGHSFNSLVNAMTRKGRGCCSYCGGLKVNESNSLTAHYPQLIIEWIQCINDLKLTHEINKKS